MSQNLRTNLETVRGHIDAASREASRAPDAITLIAASKQQPSDRVRALAEAGQRHFGENYLQDALEKIAALADLNLCWHFIGRVQSNKTKQIAHHFDWVHTIDSAKQIERLARHRESERGPLNLCFQINIDDDPNKGGIRSADEATLQQLIEQAREFPSLAVRGLMTILHPDTDPAEGYGKVAGLFQQMSTRAGPEWDTLSMGMSGDYPAAIAAGATHVRVGTALFGPRT